MNRSSHLLRFPVSALDAQAEQGSRRPVWWLVVVSLAMLAFIAVPIVVSYCAAAP